MGLFIDLSILLLIVFAIYSVLNSKKILSDLVFSAENKLTKIDSIVLYISSFLFI